MSSDDAILSADLERFSYWVQRVATERGLGMVDLQIRSGLASGTFFAAVKGRGNPTMRTITYIAAALDMPLWCLLAPTPDE
jgi:DNA-binding phage protein